MIDGTHIINKMDFTAVDSTPATSTASLTAGGSSSSSSSPVRPPQINILVDDYVLPSEPVVGKSWGAVLIHFTLLVLLLHRYFSYLLLLLLLSADYVSRFSGITEEDLNPATSRHALVTDRTAYLKLR